MKYTKLAECNYVPQIQLFTFLFHIQDFTGFNFIEDPFTLGQLPNHMGDALNSGLKKKNLHLPRKKKAQPI